MGQFTDKVVVVSGAAGALGRAGRQGFSARGGHGLCIGPPRGRLADLGLDEGSSGRLETIEDIDLSQAGVVPTLQSEVHQRAGTVDVIVHTVGGFTYGETVDTLSAETWQKMLDINVNAFLNLAKALVPDLVEKGHGKVITIGAKAALKGGAKMGAYSASKAALLRLTESMAAELAGKVFRSIVCCQGRLIPPIIGQRCPMRIFPSGYLRRRSQYTILFLASQGSDAITGASLPVYGQP